jgi:hypothetical protein
MMAVHVITSAAFWYYQRERGELETPLESLTLLLIDYLAGALLAPVSDEARSSEG